MSDHRWQGYSHAELYARIHEGSGPHASTSPVHRWTELSRSLDEIDADLAAAMNAARSQWQGEAADRAQENLRPLGEWTRTAREATERMRSCTEQQAELVARARAEMPPPVPVTAEEPGPARSMVVHLFGGQTDHEIQEARSHAAEQRAFEVMRTYQAGSEANTAALASFPTPPQVIVDGPPVSAGDQAASARRPVTITWSPAPSAPGGTTARGRVPAGGSARTGSGGAARPGNNARAGGSVCPSGRPSSAHPGSTGSSGGTSPRPRRRDDEADSVDQSATEAHGEPGALFDERRTASRPVIGGEPG